MTTNQRVETSIQSVPENRITEINIDKSEFQYTQPIQYVRSRNIEFDANSLKPVTRFYPFFGGTNVSNFITPKLLEVEMISGRFEAGEIIDSDPNFTSNRISFKLCLPDHKYGPSTNPSSKFSINPYTQSTFETSYSETTTFLNVDTKSLGLPSDTNFYGTVSEGMKLIGRTSGAMCRVRPIRLISDLNGRLIGSFFIPSSLVTGNSKFINGSNTFLLMDVQSSQQSSEMESIALIDYYSSGTYNVNETKILTTRNITITPSYNIITTTITNIKTVPYTVYV